MLLYLVSKVIEKKGAVFLKKEVIISDQATITVETAGTGEPILFIHAGIADRRMWANEIKRLASDYFVLNIDLPEHGESQILTVIRL